MYLREARKRKFFTQMVLSQATGIKQSIISKIENGYQTPCCLTVTKILEALGYKSSEIDFNNKAIPQGERNGTKKSAVAATNNH